MISSPYMLLPRALTTIITEKLQTSPKGIILYGPRQAGKTTLITEIIRKLNVRTLTVNGDQSKYVDVLASRDGDRLKSLVTGYNLLFVDEAQRIPEIGINLKIILDTIPTVKVVATAV